MSKTSFAIRSLKSFPIPTKICEDSRHSGVKAAPLHDIEGYFKVDEEVVYVDPPYTGVFTLTCNKTYKLNYYCFSMYIPAEWIHYSLIYTLIQKCFLLIFKIRWNCLLDHSSFSVKTFFYLSTILILEKGKNHLVLIWAVEWVILNIEALFRPSS